MRDLTTLPKPHLHVHLEGAVRPQTLAQLAVAAGVDLPAASGPVTGFADLFARKDLVRRCLNRPADFRRIAMEFCEDEAASGTRYAEVSFTAAAHGERLGDLDMPLAAVIDGLAEGAGRYGIECRVILDHSRRRSVRRAWNTLRLTQRHAEVVAIGLSGDESYPLEPFAEVFQEARRSGLRLVHHAGEAAGPESIRTAITVGHADRIGHGIRILDDPDLVAEARERRIPLEVCPSSNVALGFAATLTAHPFRRLRDAGLAVTLNADDPAMLGTTIATEYARIRDVYGYDDAAMADLARTGVEASFAPDDTRTRLLADIARWQDA